LGSPAGSWTSWLRFTLSGRTSSPKPSPRSSLDSIAKHLNSSKRSLHRAVSTSSSSIHDLIWHQRLDRCRRDLLDPSQSRQTIAEIAHSWGFKNFTHFSQAFRERFGVSAREARRSVLSLSD
jgi:transcriptional regulator GlxA family with amidase domain